MGNNAQQPAFPFIAGDQLNPDDRAICEGMSKRELFALNFACALTAEYIKKPIHPTMADNLIEMINSQAIKMADNLFAQLNAIQ